MKKDASITAVFGRRGVGKTTLVKRLVSDVDRLVVYDPMDEYSKSGFPSCRGLDEVKARFMTHRFSAQRIAYVPPADGDHIAALSNLSNLLWAVQAPYKDGQPVPEITLLVEEINMSYPGSLPRGVGGFTRAVLQGRHAGINLIGVTLRPALVHPNFRGNAEVVYVFQLGYDQDRAEVLKMIGRDRTEALRTLPDHTYLRVENGDVTEGKNPPI